MGPTRPQIPYTPNSTHFFLLSVPPPLSSPCWSTLPRTSGWELSHHHHSQPESIMPELWCSLSALTNLLVVSLAPPRSTSPGFSPHPAHILISTGKQVKSFDQDSDQAYQGWSPSCPAVLWDRDPICSAVVTRPMTTHGMPPVFQFVWGVPPCQHYLCPGGVFLRLSQIANDRPPQ